MGTSDVNLETDLLWKNPAGLVDTSDCENIANASRKLVCDANLGTSPWNIRPSGPYTEENMVSASNRGSALLATTDVLGVESSSYSKENGSYSSGYR